MRTIAYPLAHPLAALTALLIASPVLGPRSNPDHRRRSAKMQRVGLALAPAALIALMIKRNG